MPRDLSLDPLLQLLARYASRSADVQRRQLARGEQLKDLRTAESECGGHLRRSKQEASSRGNVVGRVGNPIVSEFQPYSALATNNRGRGLESRWPARAATERARFGHFDLRSRISLDRTTRETRLAALAAIGSAASGSVRASIPTGVMPNAMLPTSRVTLPAVP